MKKIQEKNSQIVDLLESVEKVKESEKIMSAKDFQETGEKVSFFYFRMIFLIKKNT